MNFYKENSCKGNEWVGTSSKDSQKKEKPTRPYNFYKYIYELSAKIINTTIK